MRAGVMEPFFLQHPNSNLNQILSLVNTSVIIEITIGIDAARKAPIAFICDFKDSRIKRFSVPSDFMNSDEMYLTGFSLSVSLPCSKLL